jgi:hypothetical protein
MNYSEQIVSLKGIIEINTKRDEVIRKRIFSLEKERDNKITEAIKIYFPFIGEDTTIEYCNDSLYFKRTHPDYSYLKEVFNLYLKTDTLKDKDYSRMEVSFYTTTTRHTDTWELQRLIDLGKVVEVVKNGADFMLKVINDIRNEYSEYISKLRRLHWKIDSHIASYATKIKELEKEIIKDEVLRNGYNFSNSVNIARTTTDVLLCVVRVEYINRVSKKTHKVKIVQNYGDDRNYEQIYDFRNEWLDRLIDDVLEDSEKKKKEKKQKFL